MKGQLNWFKGGLLLGASFLLAVAFVKPIGVSTQFVIADGIVWNLFSDTVVQKDAAIKSGYTSSNAYLNKSGGSYAKNVANPFNYSFVFVIAMVAGAFLSSRLGGPRPTALDRSAPEVWRQRFGNNFALRNLTVFFAGVVVLIGARLAGGCTSGHMMSGMMQTSLSGYLFALGAFAAAVPVAIMVYKRN
ncbi:putative transmembrane protein (YeeE/YedE family protein) [Desulforapulum autotrophicum HRM2]|uniref:Transmembrane protein (YeeE/YedE family protein) n=1 Tax=Desulforapulum autotrophicum (strain ATCC 43914 / DSM 3382 / VKM B-1955 / HRM2) TaxID=177437 RepID=C0QFV7_DESAH|nr:YeeE/YedE thiosulfate transporter family protein [Desulforapulum autotrophicum]ACN15525.1 putative transmembrane protein (YeeE/YedE family protein) [Desulforapulum autotrophicum HRM2]